MPTEHHAILPSQRNAVFEAVLDEGLEPADFEWGDDFSRATERLSVSLLFHRPSGFYFYFDFRRGEHHCTFSPGVDRRVEVEHPGSWSQQLATCREWLQNVKRESESPDLWTQWISGGAALFDFADRGEVSFSEVDKVQIRAAIAHFRAAIAEEFSPSLQQQQQIDDRLDYLVGAMDRLNRFDWRSVALSTLISISVALTLDVEKGHRLVALFQAALSSIRNLVGQ